MLEAAQNALKSKTEQYLFFAFLLSVPFQFKIKTSAIIAIAPFGTSFPIFTALVIWAILAKPFNPKKISLLFGIVAVQLCLFLIFQETSPVRFLIVTFQAMVVVAFLIFSREITFVSPKVRTIIFCVLWFVALHWCYQKFFLNLPRYLNRAFMYETAFLGSLMLSAGAAVFLTWLVRPKSQKTHWFFSAGLFFFVIGALTHSATILTTVALCMLWLLLIAYSLSSQLSIKKTFGAAVVLLTLLSLVGVLTGSFFEVYAKITEDISKNSSFFIWVEGLNQSLFALNQMAILGYGTGASGYIGYQQVYGTQLAIAYGENTSLYDGYGLGARILLELGPITFLLFVAWLLSAIPNVLSLIRRVNNGEATKLEDDQLFFSLFGGFLILNCLFKEALYGNVNLLLGLWLYSNVFHLSNSNRHYQE